MAAGWPTKVSYLDGDVFSASDINDTNGTINLIKPTAKGDLFAGSAANTYTKLAVGTDYNVLAADSTQTTGLNYLGAPVTYTPVWTGSTTNPVIGNGSITGSYIRYGKMCYVKIKILAGSTTTYGSGIYYVTLPFNFASNQQDFAGAFYGEDLGVAVYNGWALSIGTNQVTGSVGSSPRSAFWAATTPWTFGNTDFVMFNFIYEVA